MQLLGKPNFQGCPLDKFGERFRAGLHLFKSYTSKLVGPRRLCRALNAVVGRYRKCHLCGSWAPRQIAGLPRIEGVH